MRRTAYAIACDVDNCRSNVEVKANKTEAAHDKFQAFGWFVSPITDLCPIHAPNEYECGRCGDGFPTLRRFDAHLAACKKEAR